MKLLPFSLIISLALMGDAMMSYIAPVFIESYVKNPMIMGIILSSSSFIGLICDFLIPKIFHNKSTYFFILVAFLLSIAFPLMFTILPASLVIILSGMAIWGIYYDLFQFANFNFINSFIKKSGYPRTWGIIKSLESLAYFLGPLIAGYLLIYKFKTAFITAAIIEIFALILFLSLWRKKYIPVPGSSPVFRFQFGSWIQLIKKTYPVYIFLFLISMIDSAFWTVGPLISEQIRSQNFLGTLFLPAYTLPGILMGIYFSKYFPATGKKRFSFLSGVIAGLLMISIWFIKIPELQILIVFIFSIFLSICFPLITSIFEDFTHRLGSLHNDMIGMYDSAVNLAYIVGPIIAGILSNIFSYLGTFSILGALLAAYSVFAIIITPKKIHFSHQEFSPVGE